MTAEITYNGELRTTAIHLQSGTVIETDAPKDNHGKGERFSPTDLVATALGSCMLSIMGIAGRTHNITIENAHIAVEKIMVADPQRRIGEIKITITMPKEVTYTDKQKTILENAAKTCPVFLSLHPNTKKSVTWLW